MVKKVEYVWNILCILYILLEVLHLYNNNKAQQEFVQKNPVSFNSLVFKYI